MRLMAELEIVDAQLASALIAADGAFGLHTTVVKRIGEWRRGTSTPQSAAKVHSIEAALERLAAGTGRMSNPIQGSLLESWLKQRTRIVGDVRPLHVSARTIMQTGEDGDAVRLTGIVTDRRNKGGLCFVDVRDASTAVAIQFGAQRDALGEVAFDEIKALQKGDRVTIAARLGPNRSGGLVAWVAEAPIVREALTNVSLATAAPEQQRVAAAVITAAIRSVVDSCFTQHGFLGLATRTLSSTAGTFDGLKPLVANYPGFGTAALIAPSPSPQLVDAIVLSGADRVYSLSNCITTSFRDDLDGVETDLVMGKVLNATFPDLVAIIEDVLSAVTACLGYRLTDGTARNRTQWPELRPSGAGFPEIVTAVVPRQDPDIGETLVFRLHMNETCAPIEGAIEPFSVGTNIATLAVFPGRFLPLAEHAPIRRLYPLGAGDAS